MAALFDRQKADCFSKIDLSRKGSIDEPIVQLIGFINQHKDYFSLSSCSGRIVVFAEGGVAANEDQELGLQITKSGCDWIDVAHSPVNAEDICNKINSKLQSGQTGCIVIKFEPLILHVQARDINTAKRVHLAAVEAGFRNSGITLGRAGKVVAAVRSTHGLEVPISGESEGLLVSEEYIHFILNKANQKLEENFKRIVKLEEKVRFFLSEENREKAGKPRKVPRSRDQNNPRKEKLKESEDCDQSIDDLGALFLH